MADFEDDLSDDDLDGDYEEDEFEGDADPIEDVAEEPAEEVEKNWYILKVQVNRENSICDALERRVKMHGLEAQFGDILVPTEDIKEFTKTGKQRIVKRKLYPGYIVVNMAINDDTWFIVRETPGIGDFTGSAGKPAALGTNEIEKILKATRPAEVGPSKEPIKNAFPYKVGDQVRVNEGNFQSLEGGVETIDESNGRITVMLNMFGRPTPVQLDHWQVEKI
ncbi:MAG: transcription termination/antitermination protein NusG [Planctomycetota bacterium]|nr:transcription termination/antitermination protein NusG [Planctomycetota bacterium]